MLLNALRQLGWRAVLAEGLVGGGQFAIRQQRLDFPDRSDRVAGAAADHRQHGRHHNHEAHAGAGAAALQGFREGDQLSTSCALLEAGAGCGGSDLFGRACKP